MIWHYNCPNCDQDLQVDWEDHGDEFTCPRCRHSHYPPTPSENQLAYIGGDHWPPEIEEAVIALRGTTCDVPGCYHTYETLGLRRPASEGGRLSVDNLIPMCFHHARLKGEQVYEPWVEKLSPEERAAGAKVEIVFTKDEDEENSATASPPLTSMPPPQTKPVGGPLFIAGRARVADSHPAEGLQLVTAAPVLAGSLKRLVLHYCCEIQNPGGCQVILVAWPRNRPPDWSKGIEQAGTLSAVARHEDPGSHEGRLELKLTGTGPSGLWTAAVLLGNSGGRPELTDFLLAGYP